MDTTTWLCGPPPAEGQRQRYPSRFWPNWKRTYGPIPAKTLHMFSGSLGPEWGDTTDLRAETGAKFIGPYDALPIEADSYDLVVADPPYSAGFGNEWTTHREGLPKPKRILHEASRVAKPGAIIAILHIIIIPAYKTAGVRRSALHPILTGPNNAIRVLNVFHKQGA